MADNVTVPNFQPFDYIIGETFEVVEKQNALNLAMRQFGLSLNQTVDSITADAEAVQQARQELDAEQIVHAPGSGLPNAAGEAYSRDVVGGGGDLLAQGAFGLGATGPVTAVSDLTQDILPGLYRVRGDAVGAPAAMSASRWGTVLVRRGEGGRRTFTISESTGESTQMVPLIYEGSRLVATGSIVWVTVFSQSSILGGVSFVGGLPSGAIIEDGQNANGRYVKLANGLMVCIVSRQYNFSSTGYQTYSFPASFAAIPFVGASFEITTAADLVNAYQSTTTMATVSAVRVANAIAYAQFQPRLVTLFAIGFWL